MLDLTRALVTEPHIITRTFYASPDPFSQDKVGLNIYISTLQYLWPGGGGVGGLGLGQLPPAEDQRAADLLHPAHRGPGEHKICFYSSIYVFLFCTRARCSLVCWAPPASTCTATARCAGGGWRWAGRTHSPTPTGTSAESRSSLECKPIHLDIRVHRKTEQWLN